MKNAIGYFESEFMPAARLSIARRFGGSAMDVDDALQELRRDLLVHDGDKPLLLCKYSGHGSLRGWLSTVADRRALKDLRRARAKANGSKRPKCHA